MTLQGNFIDYISVFLGGVLVSFSPCVYPLIPVTSGFIGVKGSSSRLRGFYLSLIFVLGIAITYSILGMISAITGKIFGQISTHPISYLVMGNACILAALSFFEVININLPGANLQNKVKMSGGFLPVFFLGLVSGLVVGPCTAPALGAILVYVAAKQNIVYGFSLLFVFALGMGLLLILIGTFGAFFIRLAKPGVWMVWAKKLSGLILLVVGEYFLIKAGGGIIW